MAKQKRAPELNERKETERNFSYRIRNSVCKENSQTNVYPWHVFDVHKHFKVD